MNIISRDFLHKNLSITVEYTNKGLVTHSRKILDDYIDRAKTYLILEQKVKEGDKIVLDFDVWPDFVVWLIASAELGLILTVLDPASKSISDVLKLYNGIDHVISDQKGYINPNVFYSYYNTSQKDLILATKESILIYTTSSGSTNTPKLVKYTHEFLYKLAIRNQKVYNLLETDRCLHVHTLIHSSIIGIYFLPVLHSCSDHFYFDGDDKNWTAFVQKEKINRCAIFHKYLSLIEEQFNTDIDYKFDIIAISRLTNELKNKLNKNVNVLSAFGCSEVSGPVLLSTVNSIDSLENNFGTALDDFYKVYVNDDELVIEYNGNAIRTGDRFSIVNGDFTYEGRLDLYKINGTIVNSSELSTFINELYSTTCDVVVDLEYNLIYVRIDIDINLDLLNKHISNQLNSNYQVATLLVAPRAEYVNNVKFNANGIRLVCRQKLSLEI